MTVAMERYQIDTGTKKQSLLSFCLRDATKALLAIVTIGVFCAGCVYWQQTYGHTYGMDSHTPEFEIYFMRAFYMNISIMAVGSLALWSYLWFTREKSLDHVGPREELRRYFSFVMFLTVYTWAVYFAASYFAEQDAAWHQVVTRDTSFTPSHIFLFYTTFPMYIMIGVGSLIYAYTRLPMYRNNGVSIPHIMAVVGPFMILPNVGLNEWGHAFWFMEELFSAPLHWGFVVLGWSALFLGGVLLQVVQRVNELLPQVAREEGYAA